MSFNPSFAAVVPSFGSWKLATAMPSVKTVAAWIAARFGRRDGWLIGLAGAVIVVFIAGGAGWMVHQVNEAARTTKEEHVEQLLRAVTHQLGTVLVNIEQTLRYAEDEIREFDSPQKLVDLTGRGRIPTYLLHNLFFADPHGVEIANGMGYDDSKRLAKFEVADREYFRVHLDGYVTEAHIGRPIHDAKTGIELIPVSRAVRRWNGALMGVLVAMVDTAALQRIWSDIGFRPDDRIELIGEDGKVWFAWPQDGGQSASGKSVSFSSRIPGWPMKVVATLGQSAVDRHSFETKRIIVLSAVAGSMLVGLFCLLFANRVAAIEAVKMHLAAMIDAVPVEIIELDGNERLILANRAARTSQDWVQDPVGKTPRESIEDAIRTFRVERPDEDWDGWVAQRVAETAKSGMFEYPRPDGAFGRFYITDMPNGGRVIVRVDISETKRREAKLASEMERLTSVFQSTGAGIVLLDRDGRVLLVNQFVLDGNGKTAAEVVGRPYYDLRRSGLEPAVVEQWQRASGDQPLKPVEFERNYPAPGGGRRIIKVTANPVRDETGLRYIVLIGVDDTERRMSQIRLFDSARLANLGEMATGMAHEINQPLAVIRMASESLLEELDVQAPTLDPELATFVREKLTRIATQTERASGLVHDLRTVARKPANAAGLFDTGEAARASADLLREQLKVARIDFQVDLAPPGLMARGEPGRLQQVIINLVLNARDALLLDSTRPSTGTVGHIALRVAACPAGGAELIVEDDGPGIPEHVLPRLFEPFFTTKPTGKGTGLGLSISHDIVVRMGGNITAENGQQGGARFRVVFPAVSLSAALPIDPPGDRHGAVAWNARAGDAGFMGHIPPG